MDIDPKLSVTDLLREAKTRVDGKAMYLVLIFLTSVAVLYSYRNFADDNFTFAAWKIVFTSLFMLPLTILLYFSLNLRGSPGSIVGRLINASCLIAITVYFYYKLI